MRQCRPSLPRGQMPSTAAFCSRNTGTGLPLPKGARRLSSCTVGTVNSAISATASNLSGSGLGTGYSLAAQSLMALRNAPIFSSSMVRPAAAECPPKRSSSSAQAHKAACRLKLVGARPLPRPSPFSVEITMEGRPYFSIRRVATMPITPGCQPSPDTTITRSRTRAGSALSFSSAAAAICCSAC